MNKHHNLIYIETTDILDHVQEHDIDIVAMTETWLSNKDADIPVIKTLTPPGYSLVHLPRSSRRGGGIGILHKDHIKATGKHTFNRIRSIEAMSVKLTYHAKSITLLVIYRPPITRKNGSSVADFFSEFSDILDEYVSLADELVIVGDFNFHFDAPDNIHVHRFFELLHCHGLTQHVRQPTHQDRHILDLVIDRDNACVCDIAVADLISDHHAVHCQLAMRKPPLMVKDMTYRKTRAIDPLSFASDIMNSDLLKKAERSLDELVYQYRHVLSELLDKHAPSKTKTLTARPEAPWMEEAIFAARKERRRLERRWRLSRLTIDRQILQKQIQRVNIMILTARSTCYADKIHKKAGNPRALFHTVGSLLHTNYKPALPDHDHLEQLFNSFSNHFKDKIAIIRCDIDSHATQPTLCSSEAIATSQLSTFQQATTDEITDLVVKSASKSCRLDPIPTGLVKDNISILAPVIADIVSLSITTGVFPSAFKNALVSPLLKKTSLDQNELNSYRPVSKLSFVSKIAEKVVAARFSNHLTDNGLYEQMQSAYRPHHSTETALGKVCNDLLCSLDERKAVILVLLDMSAAFDTIDHGIMLSRLRDRFGISGTALKWFE